MIQAHHVYCELYFYYFTLFHLDHLALDPGGWGPLLKRTRPWIWAGWMGVVVHLVIVTRKGRSKGRFVLCLLYFQTLG